jgi:flagellar basal body P-ring formation protein FlgA
MNPLLKAVVALIPLFLAHAVCAETDFARKDHAHLRQTIEKFLQLQTIGLPGEVSITVGNIDSRLKLAPCTTPQAFLPHNNRAWGKTTVGVRCSAPVNWTIYVPVRVRVQGEYVAAAIPLAQGQVIRREDIAKIKGDLTSLPAGIITNTTQAIGQTVTRSIPLGTPLRQDVLRSQRAVQQGQMVKLISNGPGFQVSAEGKAQNNANEGQITQVRTNNGQVISGIAKLGGIVEVAY